MLQAALYLAERGYAVFPCRPNDKPPLGGRGCLDATADANQVEAWWTATPNANVGLATAGLLVVDIDRQPDGSPNPWPQDAEQAADLAKAPCSLTPNGGRHFIFRQPSDQALGNSVSRLAPHVDTRGDGGYVVAPPSELSSGAYRWLAGQELDCRPDQLPLPPQWLLDALAERKPAASGATVQTSGSIAEGGRNDAIFKIGSKLRGQGFGEREILALAQQFNLSHCRPPLDAAEVERTIRSSAEYEPNEGSLVETLIAGPSKDRQLRIVCLDAVAPEEVEWLWPDRVAIGKVSLLIGDPGLGKSFLTIDMAARVSAGKQWPDTSAVNPAGDVVFLAAEDDLGDTVRPRLDAAGANVKRVFAVQGVMFGRDAKEERAFTLDGDLSVLEAAIKTLPECRLVVIDPISAYMGKVDSHNNSEVRGVLGPLKELAERNRVAVLCVSHLNKSSTQSALYRVTGSLGFVAAARSAWLVSKDKEDESRRLFLSVKNNLAAEPPGLAFKIVDGRVEWEPEPVKVRADDALGDKPAKPQKSKLHEAADWLHELLANGPVRASECERLADDHGIAPSTYRRAKGHLGIVTVREKGSAGHWTCYMPGCELPTKVSNQGEQVALSTPA